MGVSLTEKAAEHVNAYLQSRGKDIPMPFGPYLAIAGWIALIWGQPLIAWYWENVVSRGLGAIRSIIRKGVENGEFRDSALDDFPHLLVSPVIFSMLWKQLFEAHAPMDTDAFFDGHIDLLLNGIRKPS